MLNCIRKNKRRCKFEIHEFKREAAEVRAQFIEKLDRHADLQCGHQSADVAALNAQQFPPQRVTNKAFFVNE